MLGKFIVAILAAHYASCASAAESPVIPSHSSIEGLLCSYGESVPKSVYANFSSQEIGAAIVRRIYRDQEQARSEKVASPVIDFKNDATVQLAFYSSSLDGIIKNGFLNQHQTNRSGGAFSPVSRAEREDRFLGYKLEETYVHGVENPVNKVRPKYAYLGLKNIPLAQHPMYRSGTGMAQNYGNIFAEFKASVTERSTFTMDDSFNLSKGDFRTTRFRDDDPGGPTAHARGYIEAQIWGEITVEDVAEFIVNCEGLEPVSDETMAKLRALGRPIYSCIIDKKNGSWVRIREGALL